MASPVRPSDSGEPDVDQVDLSVDGEQWTVRLLGRSGATGSAPLVLLGFWAADATEGPPQREALTVGHTLAEFSEWGLERALRASAPTRPEGRTSTIFAETGERRRK